MQDVRARNKDRHKPHKRHIVVKQRPFKLTSGQVDRWNPRIEYFAQDDAAPVDRCCPKRHQRLEYVLGCPLWPGPVCCKPRAMLVWHSLANEISEIHARKCIHPIVYDWEGKGRIERRLPEELGVRYGVRTRHSKRVCCTYMHNMQHSSHWLCVLVRSNQEVHPLPVISICPCELRHRGVQATASTGASLSSPP
jgi:hypothetical protein